MGVNICKNLNQYQNACDMGKCIKQIKGVYEMVKVGVELWEIHFLPDIKYNNKTI